MGGLGWNVRVAGMYFVVNLEGMQEALSGMVCMC